MSPVWRAYWIWVVGLTNGMAFALLWKEHYILAMVCGLPFILAAQVIQSLEDES